MPEDPDNKTFGIGNPFDYWVQQAHMLADQHRFPRSFIAEAAHIVRNAFTSEWLVQVFDKGWSKHSLVPQAPHHLDTLFCVAGSNQIAELLELAIYLKCLCHTKNVDSVIQIMKDNYSTDLLQLGYAYRLLRAGATEVELEPTTDRGKSDIYFEYESRSYLAECYVPMRSTLPHSVDNLAKCRQMISRAIDACPINLRVCVRLRRSITVKQGNEIGFRLGKDIRALEHPYVFKREDEVAEYTVRPLLLEDDACDLSRSESLGELATAADAVFNLYSIPSGEAGNVRLGKTTRRRNDGRILFWGPPNERKEPTEEEYIGDLGKKLSHKLRQAKRERDKSGRIVITELTWFTEDTDRSRRIGRRLQDRLFRKHEDLAAILMVQRHWTAKSRYMYGGLLIGSPMNATIPVRLFETINSQEERMDILSDAH